MDSTLIAQKSLRDAFSRTLFHIEHNPQFFSYPDESQKSSLGLLNMIERLTKHLGTAPVFSALNSPLNIQKLPPSVQCTTQHPSNTDVYPLAQACYWFATDNAQIPSYKLLLFLMDLGAPIFTPSNLYLSSGKPYIPGFELFGAEKMSPFDIALTHSDYFFLKKALNEQHVITNEHICAFEIYASLPEPMYLEISSKLKSKSEENILNQALDHPTEPVESGKGKRNKRL